MRRGRQFLFRAEIAALDDTRPTVNRERPGVRTSFA